MTTTRENFLHDPVAAAVHVATAYRLLHHFYHEVEIAERRGADVSELPGLDWKRDIAEPYARAIERALPDVAEGRLQVFALYHFAAFSLIDEQLGALSRCGSLAGDEQGRAQALRALTAIGDFIEDEATDEAVEREREVPLPADSHGTHVLDEVRAALDRIQARGAS